ncbi:MAG: hypothetical protein GIW99_05100 [Candidatus Eremiobacteraeota bacterium]|nr:hypothetical protein [Candidatus Eremiobacteraeota bacterium]
MKSPAASWPLVLAVALMAMVAGHAAELDLENLGFVADVRAGYAHVGQGFAAGISLVLFLISAVLLFRQFLAAFSVRTTSGKAILPAADALCRLGAGRIVASVLAGQVIALVAIEVLEQRLSHYAGYGIGAVFGTGHESAVLVHISIGVFAGLVLWMLSRAACRHVGSAIEIVICLVAAQRPGIVGGATALRARAASARVTTPCELALRLANRPPPLSPLQA